MELCSSTTARSSAFSRGADFRARGLVDRGITDRYDYALQTMNELPYDKWRDHDAEDSVRFYALQMHETGLIKSAQWPRSISAAPTRVRRWRRRSMPTSEASRRSSSRSGPP